jgi:hypothetical protein
MSEQGKSFRFPLQRTLPLAGSFAFLLLIILGGIFVGGYHPVVTAVLWLALVASGWLALSDWLLQATVREDGVQVRWLNFRGLRRRFVPWHQVMALSLSGHQPDVLQLVARGNVSTDKEQKWTLPADVALAEALVERGHLRPDRTNEPPGVHQAFDKLLQIRGRRKKYGLYWHWKRVEGELEDE